MKAFPVIGASAAVALMALSSGSLAMTLPPDAEQCSFDDQSPTCFFLGVFENANDDPDTVNAALKDLLGDESIAVSNMDGDWKSDDPDFGSFFEITGDGQSGFEGVWEALDGTDPVAAMTIKAGPAFALYVYGEENGSFSFGEREQGDWATVDLLNPGGNQPELSHLTLWKLGPLPPQEIPLPLPLALLGAGLLAIAWQRRRV